MKDTGISRQLDNLGRITLPIELRRSLGIGKRDYLEIYIEDEKIILMKRVPTDVFTGSGDDLIDYKGFKVSAQSIKELATLAGLI
jgi:transcriptional pleiotropic regulator of transition state genes